MRIDHRSALVVVFTADYRDETGGRLLVQMRAMVVGAF